MYRILEDTEKQPAFGRRRRCMSTARQQDSGAAHPVQYSTAKCAQHQTYILNLHGTKLNHKSTASVPHPSQTIFLSNPNSVKILGFVQVHRPVIFTVADLRGLRPPGVENHRNHPMESSLYDND